MRNGYVVYSHVGKWKLAIRQDFSRFKRPYLFFNSRCSCNLGSPPYRFCSHHLEVIYPPSKGDITFLSLEPKGRAIEIVWQGVDGSIQKVRDILLKLGFSTPFLRWRGQKQIEVFGNVTRIEVRYLLMFIREWLFDSRSAHRLKVLSCATDGNPDKRLFLEAEIVNTTLPQLTNGRTPTYTLKVYQIDNGDDGYHAKIELVAIAPHRVWFTTEEVEEIKQGMAGLIQAILLGAEMTPVGLYGKQLGTAYVFNPAKGGHYGRWLDDAAYWAYRVSKQGHNSVTLNSLRTAFELCACRELGSSNFSRAVKECPVLAKSSFCGRNLRKILRFPVRDPAKVARIMKFIDQIPDYMPSEFIYRVINRGC